MGPAPPTSPLRLSAHLGERGSPGAGGLSAPLLAAGQGLFPAHVVKRVRTSCAHPHSHSRAWFSWHGGLGHPASPPLACPPVAVWSWLMSLAVGPSTCSTA